MMMLFGARPQTTATSSSCDGSAADLRLVTLSTDETVWRRTGALSPCACCVGRGQRSQDGSWAEWRKCVYMCARQYELGKAYTNGATELGWQLEKLHATSLILRSFVLPSQLSWGQFGGATSATHRSGSSRIAKNVAVFSNSFNGDMMCVSCLVRSLV
jgi:hypothetical protein